MRLQPQFRYFSALLHTKILDRQEDRKNGFKQNCGKKTSQILDMLFLEVFCITDQKILAGAVGAHLLLAPANKAPKTRFLPILGLKNPEIQKFFFLQISLFVGPIDGINNIFFSEVTYWLYKDF